MTTQLVTDPEAVAQALEECDRLGIDEFRIKHGFGPATKYPLLWNGRQYDSKAIYGVAHKYQFGEQLTAGQFFGGDSRVVPQLRQLGFEIPGPEQNEIARAPKAFIALWNFQEWPSGNVAMEAGRQRLLAGKEFHEPWTMGSRKKGVEKGDRFFLIKVGDGARGVIAAGRALGPLRQSVKHRKDGTNKPVMRADIAWDEILTAETLLPKDRLQAEIGDQSWTFLGSGVMLDESHAAALVDLWSEHVEGGRTEPEGAGHFVLEARYARRTSTSRLHQAAFREKLLAATKYPKCVVCGFDEESLLDAAHIIPDSAGGKSDSHNGRLLCLNHHRAHDRGMFRLVNDQAEWSQDARPFGRPIALETDCATGAPMPQ